MIRKPPQNWSDQGKTVAAAQSAVAVAQYATGATKRGFSLVKGIVLGGFAALWGFAGLAQLVIGGLSGRAQGASGLMILLLAAIPGYFAWRNLRKAFGWDAGPQPRAFANGADTNGAHPFAPQPPKFNALHGGERREVPNSQAQLIKSLLFGIGLIPLGFYVAQAPKPLVSLVGVLMLFVGPFVVLKSLRGLIGGAVAFSYDSEGITMPGWFGEKQLLWRDVSDFSVRTVTTYAYGIVKMGSRHSLYALKTGGGKKLLPTQFTGLDVEGLSQLAAQLELYRSGLAGLGPRFSQDYSQAHAAATLPPSQGSGQVGSGQVGSGQVGFGRIDTGLAPSVPFANRPGPAAAPSFGRRQGAFGNR